MSFNIWVGGGKSITETAKVIKETGADIIGIQESFRDDINMAVHIADSMGWYSYSTGGSTSIISRYAVVDTSSLGYGVKIQVDKQRFVWMFNVHLMYCPYEPYQLSGIEYCGAPLLSTPAEAVTSAWDTRGKEVLSVIEDIKDVQKEGYPVFLTGDFNEPSFLDWTERAVEARLCQYIVPWPATKAFVERADMSDSYRTVFPDEVAIPGRTWTPWPEKDAYTEVLDRIDFVLYWGKVQTLKSELAGENSDLSDLKFDNYPSDHRAVVTTFTFL
jgi:endonuclease/exonuclease/phosphatase family metal-dependent hydrolase